MTCRYVDLKGNEVKPDYKLRQVSDNEVEAYIAVFGVRDSYGTVAVKGCFAKSIKERGPQSNANDKIVHLWCHQSHEPVGQYTELVEDDYGLRARIKFDVDAGGTPMRVYRQTKSGTVNQYSYGFDYVWDRMEYDEETDSILMYDLVLVEGTSLALGASNPATHTIRSRQDYLKRIEELSLDVEDVLKGLPRSKQFELRMLIGEYKTLAETVAPVETPDPPKPGKLSIGGYNIDVNKL